MRVSISSTPKMDFHILHGKISDKLDMDYVNLRVFLTITTCGMAAKPSCLKGEEWDCIILDEAQAIKNPLTKRTRTLRELKGAMRTATTGTLIENDLLNLWSLLDFLNKELLGTATEFKAFVKRLEEHPEGYQKLKAVIAPFMLRRLETDKTIISDPPEKLEPDEYVTLSKQQVVLYRKLIADMEERIKGSEGMERRGLVLSTITKLRQICNHSDRYLEEESYRIKDSGKLEMLKEICKTICEKRERVLISTQYKEIIPHLHTTLAKIFHQEGYILRGGTPVKKRSKIVAAFQQEVYVPYIALSLKTAGIGLNLTAANHVIYFDRWWGPVVENQAVDRAFHIGQEKSVIVYKLVSKGMMKEKIDELIKSKMELSQQVIGDGKETWITEMNSEELMNLLCLDAKRVYEQALENSRIFSAISRGTAI